MDIQVRSLRLEDIPSISDIYQLLTSKVPDEDDLENKMEYGESLLSIGAVVDDKLVGFMFGSIDYNQFGQEGSIGIIGLLGVHPEYQDKQVGRMLGKEMITQFRGLGITKIRTQVSNQDSVLIKFFMNLGLKPSNWTMLETEL